MATQDPPRPARRRSRTAQKIFMFTGFGLAVPITGLFIRADAEMNLFVATWALAGAWAFVASIFVAFYNGLRYRDWSAFNQSPANALHEPLSDPHNDSLARQYDYEEHAYTSELVGHYGRFDNLRN